MTIFSTGKEEPKAWLQVQCWLQPPRRKGIEDFNTHGFFSAVSGFWVSRSCNNRETALKGQHAEQQEFREVDQTERINQDTWKRPTPLRAGRQIAILPCNALCFRSLMVNYRCDVPTGIGRSSFTHERWFDTYHVSYWVCFAATSCTMISYNPS